MDTKQDSADKLSQGQILSTFQNSLEVEEEVKNPPFYWQISTLVIVLYRSFNVKKH